MKECAKVLRLLSCYIDNETDRADSALIKEHLISCPVCYKEMFELTRTKEVLLKKELKPLPPDFLVYRLRGKIAEERSQLERTSGVVLGNISRRLIPVPIAAIVLLVVFLFFGSSGGGNSGNYSLTDHLLSGTHVTTQATLELVLGIQNY